ncbi:MAG: hypothetical protein PUD92_02625, partial [Clostridiales bacterium]|nr:hypothetical protein [Clostridiales bacterium]
MLYDGGLYHSYVFGDNGDGGYSFVVIFSGVQDIKSTAEVAVVQKVKGITIFNDVECTELIVSISGLSDIGVLVEGFVDVYEGSVIVYQIGREGYVYESDWYEIFSPTDDYDSMLKDTLYTSGFGAALKH